MDTTTEVCLSGMGKIFTNHKDNGDAHLNIYEEKCGGTECPNYGKRGYRFVGNRSGNYIDLILDFEVDDITVNYSFKHYISREADRRINFRYEPGIEEDKLVFFNITPESC